MLQYFKLNFKKIVILLVLIGSNAALIGQNQEKQFWDHVRFGGGIGLSFGDGFFSGTLAPSAIYQLNDQFAMGIGLNGTYNKQKNFYSSTIIGASAIGLFNVFRELQLSAEFEELNVSREWDDSLGFEDDNYWYPALFLGAGYSAGNVTIGVKYDVLYDESKSVYADAYFPFVRVYF
ncbi:MAG: alpha-ketoglutarate decarboxylase [Flavobacteriaceae bacterium]|nr:alpha-ketoglutarate decarboxylase [Flavobacteriaceae bacterium]